MKRKLLQGSNGPSTSAMKAAAREKKFDELTGAIRITNAQLAYDGASFRFTDNGEISIRTAPQPWAYAVRFPLRSQVPIGSCGILRVTVLVEDGTLAVGAENHIGDQIVGEQMLSARPGAPQEAEILIPDVSQIQALMLRNGPQPGQCRGVVTSVALHVERQPAAAAQSRSSMV